ncbi:MAG: DUF5615 family PIN-like protein [Chroococcales cyanobacterium]
MSLKLLLDEDSQAKYLVNLLQRQGYDVIPVKVAGLNGKPDIAVLNYARQEERVLLTRNCEDFLILHQSNPVHPGILAVYQDPDPAKNMSYQAIAKAIANLESANYGLTNSFIILNQWNY